MQRGLGFGTKITNNTAKTKNPITAALVITATTAGNNETETTAADKQEQEY
jgi:hypothetical protein